MEMAAEPNDAAGRGGAGRPTDALALCRALAEASPLPQAELDGKTGLIRHVNLAFCLLTGKTREKLIGSEFSKVAPVGERCEAQLEEANRTGKAQAHVGLALSAPHPSRWSYTMWPVLSGDDGPLGIIIQVTEATAFNDDAIVINQALMIGSVRQHELTEAAELLNTQLQALIVVRDKAEEALIGSEKLASAGRMAAVLAHEINNPLAAVMNLLFLVEAAGGLAPAARRYLEMADGELKRIAHITRQALGFYREPSTPTTFQAASLLDSVLDLLQAKIRSKGATVHAQSDERLQMTACRGELRQAFSNLLLNSLEAVGDHGKVSMRISSVSDARSGEAAVRMTVADNGHGISGSALPRIFEPFFTTKGLIGNGLGLWVTVQIVEKHGGRVQVRSRTEGPRRGTSISVILPANVSWIGRGSR